MRHFLWQHVSRVYSTGKIESDYLIAEETDTEPLLENLSVDEVKGLREACDRIIKYDELREKQLTKSKENGNKG